MPKDIPTSPYVMYDKYQGIADWLGYEKKVNKPKKGAKFEDTWMSYEDARNFTRSLNLKSYNEWKKYCEDKRDDLPKKPIKIPKSPNALYTGKGWINWQDWLGSTTRRTTNALTFKEARDFVRSLNLKNTYEWINYKKGKLTHLEPIPDNIPKTPNSFYKNDGWIGMHNWLGVE